MLRMLEAQAPAKQTVTDTINTLCSRLNNATLLEDRRTSIQGLRSFAKEYPASVASGSLRGLIACLTKDTEDVDTIKLALETLVMLFNPNPQSPEASEEIALWSADEFTQRQDNIQTLLQLLETHDFYSRLYSLQLITAIFASRPEKTQECILSAGSGTSTLVSMLDDPREPIRNASLVLLADLTQSSPELQKLVAFESAFDKIFSLIDIEGGLRDGGIIIQDCLDLLANLVRQNSSNQSLFRETGCVTKLATLLKNVEKQVDPEEQPRDPYSNPQTIKNLWGFLAVTRLFLVTGSIGTNLNQKSFEKHGILQETLNLAFRQAIDPAIRTEALYTCADLIRGNPDLQAGFALLQVPTHSHQQNGTTNGLVSVHIIDALLDLVIVAPFNTLFNIRMAASECIKAYFTDHTQIKLHFLNRAIQGHQAGEDETANILTTLLRDGAVPGTDPYKVWFAATLLLHLIWSDKTAKHLLIAVVEGDAESGEEVVTCIQTLANNLTAAIAGDEDERIIIGYFMLLISYLFEDPEAVNDFLGEASFVTSFIRSVSVLPTSNPIISGLSALLLGIVYHYATKDSPIPRRKLQPILLSGMGRDKYLQALSLLRQHPLIREFEIFSPSSGAQSSDLAPYAYFDGTFVDFFKDNYSKFARAIDRDPGIEAQVNEDSGIDRDLVDSLRTELDAKVTALKQAEETILDLEQKLESVGTIHKQETALISSEIARLQNINASLQKNHESEIQAVTSQHTVKVEELQSSLNKQILALQSTLESTKAAHAAEAERTKDYYERSLGQSRSTKTQLESRITTLQKSLSDAQAELSKLRISHTAALATAKADAQKAVTEANEKAVKAAEAREKVIRDLQDENATWKRANEALKNTASKKDRRLSEVSAELVKVKEGQEDERTKVGMLEKEVETLTAKLEATKKAGKGAKSDSGDVKKLEEEMKTLKEKLEKSEKEKEEAREGQKSAQGEMDDLLMILADLEAKRKADKKRLRDLGQEVSEDEDEEEEDEVE